MKTKTKVIVAVSAAIVILILLFVTIGVGFWYYTGFRQHEPALRAKLDKASEDGKQFGMTSDQNGCMAKGLTIADPPNTFDVSDYDFDFECLRTSRRSPGFCDGVSLAYDDGWPEDQCRDNKQNPKACATAYDVKQSTCRWESKK